MNGAQSCNTSASDLSHDILVTIFELTIAVCAIKELRFMPFVLAAVCKQWQTSEHACSALWSTIGFNLHRPSDSTISKAKLRNNWVIRQLLDAEKDIAMVRNALSLSGTTSLRIVVTPSEDTNLKRRKVLEYARGQRFFDLVVGCKGTMGFLDRIKSFDITVATVQTGRLFRKMVMKMGFAPQLESMSLVCTDPHNVATFDVPGHTWMYIFPLVGGGFLSTPLLRSLTISTVHFLRVEEVGLSSMVGVRSLTLMSLGHSEQGDFNPLKLCPRLASMPNLIHLELNGLMKNDDPEMSDFDLWFFASEELPLLTLPTLKTLTIRGINSPFLLKFVKHIRAPFLETLTLSDMINDCHLILALITIEARLKDFPLLHNLVIHNMCFIMYQSVLRHLDWITKLTVTGISQCNCTLDEKEGHTSYYEHFVDEPALEHSSLGTTLMYPCRNLRELTIEVHGRKHCEEVLNMLKGRAAASFMMENGSPRSTMLQKLTVLDCPCHEPLPDVYRKELPKHVPEFEGPQRKHAVQDCAA